MWVSREKRPLCRSCTEVSILAFCIQECGRASGTWQSSHCSTHTLQGSPLTVAAIATQSTCHRAVARGPPPPKKQQDPRITPYLSIITFLICSVPSNWPYVCSYLLWRSFPHGQEGQPETTQWTSLMHVYNKWASLSNKYMCTAPHNLRRTLKIATVLWSHYFLWNSSWGLGMAMGERRERGDRSSNLTTNQFHCLFL